ILCSHTMCPALFLLILLSCTICHYGHSCSLENITIALDKDSCGNCLTINTTACAGFCFTQDPVYKSSLAPFSQQTCTIKEVTYETIQLPNCTGHGDTVYTFPVALSCECGLCHTDSTDCGSPTFGSTDCPTK
uniref:Follicle stimulating hormone subunit beta n=1 Tax=Erpetoichthys calabaricus TaxID=27687 RepID=A0A8C4TKB6_ERPCA